MQTRARFQHDLTSMEKQIHEMVDGVANALKQSVDVLCKQDVAKAKKLITFDTQLNEAEQSIKEGATLLITRQQPVASDLRRLLFAIQVTSDLERMGDHAKNINKSTIHIGEQNKLPIPIHIQKMANLALAMLETAMNAWQHADISVARKLTQMDKEIDTLYNDVIQHTLSNNHYDKDFMMQIGLIARYLERYADHITNIGEYIFYLVKGESTELNEKQ
ncbi:phosphate signaling complex protein PhoU [Pontibacillus litoralis]|uniref:Phosphate-specific transport system accessory protein PhoU n=1 Tax=Pontibacillus litoralis JSM 072002 TaxID=1385512 RepID=A0A0A5G7Z6_9BACI|nr:phosphate signaling complex protein PhoU [Pontibacillus litoralis]KGX87230.1 transcriptional regulator [Pontibacillus litoralis JSM 072002]